MKLKKLISLGMAMAMTAGMLLTGCGAGSSEAENTQEVQEQETESSHENKTKEESDDENKETTGGEQAEASNIASDTELIDALKKKYSAADKQEYTGNVIKINRDENLQIEIGYNPWDEDKVPVSESFVVYQDAQLRYPVQVGSYDYDMDAGILTIQAPYYGVAEMDGSEVDLSHLTGNYLSEDEANGWGTLSQYYLATNVDVTTGEALETPVVTVIKVNAELSQTPQLVFDQTEDGFARFSWQEIPGAEGYLLFKINKDESGLWDYTSVFADVQGTEWTSESEAHEFEGQILSLNYRFEQYYTSDDSLAWMEDTDSFLLEYHDDIAYDEYYREYFGVIAYGQGGCSHISNLLSAMDLAHMLPTEKAGYANEVFFDINGTLDLPAVMSVTMCDGTTAQKVIEYDFDSVEKFEDNGYFYITAKGIQTPFTEELHVYDVNWDTLDADLKVIKERQEELQNKGGNVAPTLTVDEEAPAPEEETDEADVKEEVTEEKEEALKPEETKEEAGEPTEITVTANSALSEYVALNMLKTNGAIDLSQFPEAADTQLVIDAFFEAQYQNPLILGVQGGSIDTENRILYVEYDFDSEETVKKQQEITARVSTITDQIITEDMTDFEKDMAINTWLCENAVYDDAALENAEKYSFTQVDEDFYDSFTAYGILVDGVGVCVSYSAAFKLLADAAGLESIVVTGYLDGSVPHAWNKVNLDGQWYIVDATNNDNDMISNALLNLSDSAAGSTLVENESFVEDTSLSAYAAADDELEFYHTQDRYYDVDEVSSELAELLVSDGKAVLRTDYDIDDEEFYTIAQQAADESQKNISGFYWMGVIHLEE